MAIDEPLAREIEHQGRPDIRAVAVPANEGGQRGRRARLIRRSHLRTQRQQDDDTESAAMPPPHRQSAQFRQPRQHFL